MPRLAAAARGLDVYLFLFGMMLLSETARREGCSIGWPSKRSSMRAARRSGCFCSFMASARSSRCSCLMTRADARSRRKLRGPRIASVSPSWIVMETQLTFEHQDCHRSNIAPMRACQIGRFALENRPAGKSEPSAAVTRLRQNRTGRGNGNEAHYNSIDHNSIDRRLSSSSHVCSKPTFSSQLDRS